MDLRVPPMQPTEDPLLKVLAQMQLTREGSVMAQPLLPQWRKDNPMLDTILALVDILLGDPLSNISSPVGPTATLGPVRTAAQKHILKAIHRLDPGILRQVRSNPRRLEVYEGTPIFNKGDLGEYIGGPEFGMVRIHPNVMRGRDPQGFTFGPQERVLNVENTPAVALHEATHFLNQPRVQRTQPQDAATIATLLQEYLPSLGAQGQIAGNLRSGKPNLAMDEALAHLAVAGTANWVPDPMIRALYEALKPR